MSSKNVYVVILFFILTFIFLIYIRSNLLNSNMDLSSILPISDNTMTVSDNTVNENKIVVLETSLGNITLEIYNSTMPLTANNFTKLVNDGFYNNQVFHRVIPRFMIQSGDPTGTGTGGPGYTIQDEFTDVNSNIEGTISMANAGPNTGGSQFFINVFDNNYLDKKHPVFGKVIEGYDIAVKISEVQRDSNDRPLEDIHILKAYIK